MKTSSPKQMAIGIALISAFLSVVITSVLFYFNNSPVILLLLLLGLVVFFIIYLIVFYSLTGFVFKKLKPIYKIIHDINKYEDKLRKDIEEKDIIPNVQNEVMIWADKKTKEIAQLRQQEKYRREFLGNVSHELKTPIFNIQGYVLTLLDGGLEDKTINRKYLQRTEKSINRLISIVNDLESISKLESGELKLEQRKFNIVKLVQESFEIHEMLAKERNIKLKFKTKPEKAIYVYADRDKILEVINNLLVNSIKYGSEKGSTVVGFMDMEDEILIEIADNGIGIRETDLPRIFERFYRTDKSRSREMGGTGLGLSIVKHIIEAHNKSITVSSKIEKGSSFAFTLDKAI